MSLNVTAYQKSYKLQESDLLPPDNSCRFCGSADRKGVFELQTNPDVQLLRCKNCYAYSSSRMPSDDALASYYNRYYESGIFEKTGEQVTSDDSFRQASLLAGKIRKYVPAGDIRILDFGGGDGSISVKMALELLNYQFPHIEIIVVDLNQMEIDSPDSSITISNTQNLDSVNGEFDIVLASAILEHLPDPNRIIQSLLKFLKTDGVFYARTPSVAKIISTFALMGIKIDFTFPGHLHDLGQKFWNGYMDKCLPDKRNYVILESRPSVSETTYRHYFFRSLVSNLLKLPWYILGSRYEMVGGWTILIKKIQ